MKRHSDQLAERHTEFIGLNGVDMRGLAQIEFISSTTK